MSNEILKFGENGTTADLLTQAEYSADPQRLIGNQPGIARQKLVNKVLRQCAFISNAFAEYIAVKTGGNVLDDGNTSSLLALITTAFTYTFTNDNYIINGNFNFWQRNSTFSVTTTNTYTADRWVGVLTGSTSTVARQATALTEAFNASFFLRSAVTSSVGVSNFFYLQQRIENVSRLAQTQVTLSFYAKADSSRNMSVEMIQNFGTGGSPSAEVTALGVTKVALTTSWQKFTVTVSLPSISGKVLGSKSNSYTGVNFWQDAGANFNARTSSLGQQSGTFDIAQVKLELGANATAFTLAGKTLAGELDNCQRYYEKSYDLNVVPGTNTNDGRKTFSAVGNAFYRDTATFKVTKRATPTTYVWSWNGVVDTAARDSGTTYTFPTSTVGQSSFTAQGASFVSNIEYSWQWVADAEIY